MQIDGYYTGVGTPYVSKETSLANVKKTNGHLKMSDSLLLSDEVKTLREQMKKGHEIMVNSIVNPNADPSDLFSYRPYHQYLVFSQYLNDTGFYEDHDRDTIQNMENILMQVTEALDSLGHYHVNGRMGSGSRGGGELMLSSAEAQLEFASSVSALHVFSDKFLTDNSKVKEGFDQLIDQYTTHNKDAVTNHRSVHEKFFEARAKMTNLPPVSLDAEQRKNLTITNKLGATEYTSEEIMDMVDKYTKQFNELKDASEVDLLMFQLQEQLVNYVTKGFSSKDSNLQTAKDSIKEQTNKTISHISDYWKILLSS
ncbi:hypothetical protein ACFQ4Z_13025 [Oceanobacillus oncorhynchi subsp. oncorhynchi]|uniref:hypothetical protein n=1 Tax=Oceanobacillus oncorhynchi TaxID=545501 RepID=UPI00363A52D7